MKTWSLAKNIGSIIPWSCNIIIIEVFVIVHVIEYDILKILHFNFFYFGDYLFDPNGFVQEQTEIESNKEKSEWQQNHWYLKCEIFKTFSKQAREHLQ